MDPLSVSASIAGLITLADVIATRIFHFVKTVRGAEEEVSALLSEKILAHLDKCSPEKLDGIQGTLHNAKRKLRWPLSKPQTKELLQDLARYKATLTLALSVDSMTGLLNTLAKQDSVADTVQELKSDWKKWHMDEFERKLKENQRTVLNMLEPVDPQERYKIAINVRFRGTGTWFLDSETFQDFLKRENGKLWLYGIPGAGKTILCSTVVEAVEAMQDGTASAFFYCDYKDPGTQVLRNILGSMIRQLALQDPAALEEVMTFHQRHTKPDRQDLDLNLRVDDNLLAELLKTMTRKFKSVILIVDGLDECLNDRRNILNVLSQLATPDAGNVRTVYTSRKETDIEEALREFESYSVAAASSDIRLFVASELETRIADKRLTLKDPALRDLILDRLVNKAEGMFQWVKCQLDHLCELYSDRDRRKALDSLPPTLPATYERILERINGRPVEVQKLVQRTLKWIALARQPLKVEALAEAVSVNPNHRSLDPDGVPDKMDIRRCCSSMIREGPHDTLQLSHFSVREFLTAIDPIRRPDLAPYRIHTPDTELELGSTCLMYLLFDAFKTPLPRDRDTAFLQKLENHRFYLHAVDYWHMYTQSSHDDKGLSDLMTSLFRPSKCRQFLWWAYLRLWLWYPNLSHKELLGALNDATPLHLVCCIGANSTLRLLLTTGQNVNRRSLKFRTPLYCALVGERCLKAPVDVLVTTKQSSVDSERRCGAVQLLVDAGAKQKVGTSSGLWDDALYVAVVHVFNKNVVPILLNAGFTFSKPLMEAFQEYIVNRGKRTDLLRTLESITEENLEPESTPIFLQLLTLSSSEDYWGEFTVDFKWSSGNQMDLDSMPNDARREYYSTLQEAAQSGQHEVVTLCLEKVKDIAARDPDTLSEALRLAASNGHISVLELLLEEGADPFLSDSEGQTALHLAIEGLHLDTVLRLVDLYLESGRPLSPKTVHGMTPILCSIKAGSTEILSLLAKEDKEFGDESTILATRDDGFGAFHFAAQASNLGLAKMLRDLGFPVNIQSSDGMTPIDVSLMHASTSEIKSFINFYTEESRVDFTPSQKTKTSVVHIIAGRAVSFAMTAWNVLFEDAHFRQALSHNPDMLGENAMGWTPLSMAIERFLKNFPEEEPDFIHILCNECLEANVKDTLITDAIHRLSKQLQDLSRQPQFQIHNGLDFLSEKWIPQIFQSLLIAGARIDAEDESGRRALDYVARWSNQSLAEAVRKVLPKDIEPRDTTGEAIPVMPAAPEIPRAILDVAASPDEFRHAVRRGDLAACLRLIEIGCGIDGIPRATTEARGICSCTELLAALYLGHDSIAMTLIQNGADLNARGCEACPYSRFTPLHLAAAMMKPDLVSLLLERGADPTSVARGRNVLHIALEVDGGYFHSWQPWVYGLEPDKFVEGVWDHRRSRRYQHDRAERDWTERDPRYQRESERAAAVMAEFELRARELRQTNSQRSPPNPDSALDPGSEDLLADSEARPNPSSAVSSSHEHQRAFDAFQKMGDRSRARIRRGRFRARYRYINPRQVDSESEPGAIRTTDSSRSRASWSSDDEDWDLQRHVDADLSRIFYEVLARQEELQYEEDCRRFRSDPSPRSRLLQILLSLREASALLNMRITRLALRGFLPLHVAIKEQLPDAVLQLLEHDACSPLPLIRHGVDSDTPLHMAVRLGDTFSVRTLIEHGAPVNVAITGGSTPIFEAAWRGDIRLLGLLRTKGTDVQVRDCLGKTLLHAVANGVGSSRDEAENSMLGAMLWCIRHGVDPNAADAEGWRVIQNVRSSHIKHLRAAGADVTLDMKRNVLPIHWDQQTCLIRDMEETFTGLTQAQISQLLEKRSSMGTLLYSAASCGRLAKVSYLVKMGSKVNAVGGDFGTALEAAWRLGWFNVVAYLLQQGAGVTEVEDHGVIRGAHYWELGSFYCIPDNCGAWSVASSIRPVFNVR